MRKTRKVELWGMMAMIVLAFTTATAGELDSKTEKIVRRFVETSLDKVEGQATLAVFPFQAEEKLAKRKVDFAVGEVLTQKLLQSGKFRLVERAQLETVLKEQKLGLTGAIESETAAKVGKLLGARLAALGGVSRLGKTYQIVAKLVDTESGEILTSEVYEVPIRVFDEEAASYLVLTPEYQKIGVYFFTGYGPPGQVSDLPPITRWGLTLIPSNKPMYMVAGGLGIRYWPWRRWMVDISCPLGAVLTEDVTSDADKLTYTLSPTPVEGPERGIPRNRINLFVFRLSLHRVVEFSNKFHGYAGIGEMFTRLSWPKGDAKDYSTNVYVDTTSLWVSPEGKALSYISPYFRLGLEWKPQARFGWAVFGNFHIQKKELDLETRFINAATNEEETVSVGRFVFPRFFVETSLSLYF